MARDQLSAPFDLTFETPNLCTVQSIQEGKHIYDPATYKDIPFILTIYTPAYHYLVSWLPKHPDNRFFTGRIVAMVFMILASCCLFFPQDLNKDLGFSAEDRAENIRRVAEVGKLFVGAGVITVTAFISPYRADREAAPETISNDAFFEVFCNTPLEVCEQRDPKGVYKKARAGQIKGFTGIDDPYEAPENPELVIDTSKTSPQEAAVAICELLEAAGKIPPLQA